jgi:hypothetical protein
MQPAVDLMQEPADPARPELYTLRKLSAFFETQYVLWRIWHDHPKLFLRDDPWEIIIDIANSFRRVMKTVTPRSGPTPIIHRLSSLPWTLYSSVEGGFGQLRAHLSLVPATVHADTRWWIEEADNPRLHGGAPAFAHHSSCPTEIVNCHNGRLAALAFDSNELGILEQNQRSVLRVAVNTEAQAQRIAEMNRW